MTTTTRFFVKLSTIFNRGVAISTLMLACFWAPQVLAAEPVSNTADGVTGIGVVRLVLGKAYLHAPNQTRQLIQVGMDIRAGDEIFTEANGHVYILFVDAAMVSVRPGSLLQIQRYDFNARRPELSSVKFNLVEGVTRAISGEAAKAAGERFRLNTPIAAIGVRGTDFSVSATPETVRARVNEGIIVLAPFSSECTIDSFGPCTSNALELAGNSLQLIELDSDVPLPRLLAAPEVRDPDMIREEVELAVVSAGVNAVDRIVNNEENAVDRTVSNEVFLEGVTSTKVVTEATVVAVASSPAKEPSPDISTDPLTPPAKEPSPDISTDPLTPPAIPDFTPETALSTASLTGRQLLWGRFNVGQGELERITLDWQEALVERKVTVGNFEYALFRPVNEGQALERGLSVVSFSLSSAQAFYNNDNGVVAMQVNDGNLDLDFQANSFATELNLNHSITGPVDFFADGRLTRDGFFAAKTDTQSMAGAVSLDGREAGYFFDRQLENGSIKGLTLWDSQ
jgi:hypothetical protein